MPIHTRPRRCPFPVLVVRNKDEVPFTEHSVARLPDLSFYGDTRVRLL